MMSETLPIEHESPLKKAKLDAEETIPNSPLSGISSDDEYGFEHIQDKSLIEEYRKYERQVKESNGFDIDFVPRAFRSVIGRHILPCDLDNPEEQELIKEITDFAIAEYNHFMKPMSELQLVKIEKANRPPSPSFNYDCYITFEAVDAVSKQPGTYQTNIVASHEKDVKQMFQIRRKGQKKDILFPVHLDRKEEYERIKKCTDSAVSLYNEMQEGNFEIQLVRIVKAVQDAMVCRSYGIAFEAMDTISRQTNTYYTRVNYVSREDEEDIIAVNDVWLKGEKHISRCCWEDHFAEFEEEDGALGHI